MPRRPCSSCFLFSLTRPASNYPPVPHPFNLAYAGAAASPPSWLTPARPSEAGHASPAWTSHGRVRQLGLLKKSAEDTGGAEPPRHTSMAHPPPLDPAAHAVRPPSRYIQGGSGTPYSPCVCNKQHSGSVSLSLLTAPTSVWEGDAATVLRVADAQKRTRSHPVYDLRPGASALIHSGWRAGCAGCAGCAEMRRPGWPSRGGKSFRGSNSAGFM